MTWGVSVGEGKEKTETDPRYSVWLGREDEAAVGTEHKMVQTSERSVQLGEDYPHCPGRRGAWLEDSTLW